MIRRVGLTFLLALALGAAAGAPVREPAGPGPAAPAAGEGIGRPVAGGPRTFTDPVPFSAWRIDPRRPASPTAYA